MELLPEFTAFPNFNNTSSPTDIDADILPYPVDQTSTKKRQKKEQNRYFILTSKEVIEQKENQIKLKNEKELKKTQAKLKRAMKSEKVNVKKMKVNKK